MLNKAEVKQGKVALPPPPFCWSYSKISHVHCLTLTFSLPLLFYEKVKVLTIVAPEFKAAVNHFIS